MDEKTITQALRKIGGTTSKSHSTTQTYTLHLFDKFGTIYGRLWSTPETGTKPHSALVNEWSELLQGLDVSQIKYALEYIKSGSSDFSKYPPNCIEFGELAKSFRPAHKQKAISYNLKKDWRDVEISERVRKLKSDPDWPTAVKKAKESGNTLEYLLKWSRNRPV